MFEAFKDVLKDILSGDVDKQTVVAAAYERVKALYGEPIADILLETLGRIEEEIEHGRIHGNDAIGSDCERDIRRGGSGRDSGETVEGRPGIVDAISRSDPLHGHDSGSCDVENNPDNRQTEFVGGFDERTDSSLPYEGRPYSNINLGGNGCNEVATEYERRAITIPKNPRRDDK